MRMWEALTGAQVLALRTQLKMSRDQFMAACGFEGKSAARISNIERKDSWKDGDKVRVVTALRQLYFDRQLPQPDIIGDDEYTGPSLDDVQLPAPVKECPHASGFSRTEDNRWVCASCGEETPRAKEARLAYEATQAGPAGRTGAIEDAEHGPVEVKDVILENVTISPDVPVGAQVAMAELFNGVAVDVVDLAVDDLESMWDDLLATVVDTSEVRKSDYMITNSESRAWKRCHRKWWLEYYRKLGTRNVDYTGARATGARVHRALQAAYSGAGERVDPRDALERVIVEDWTEITAIITDPTELAIVAERFTSANALERAMIEGYVEWLGETGADADYTVTGSEQVLSALFDLEVDGKTYLVELIGKLDARLRRKSDGALLFVDHKTVQNFVDAVPTLKQNEQMLTYVLLEALNAADDEYVSGALYNMLRKVKRTGTAKPPFFERLEVHHNPYEIDSFRAHLRGTTTEILRARDAIDAGQSHHLVAYPNPTNDCRWDCQFFKVCGMLDDGSPGVEDMLSTVYESVNPIERYDGLTPERSTVDHREIVQ